MKDISRALLVVILFVSAGYSLSYAQQPAQQAAPPAATQPAPAPAQAAAPAPANAPASVPATVVLQEGTDVSLTFDEDISSKTAAEGDPVAFVLAEDLKVGQRGGGQGRLPRVW